MVPAVKTPQRYFHRLHSHDSAGEFFLHSQDWAGEFFLKSSGLWDSMCLWRKKQKAPLLWNTWEKHTLLRYVPSITPFTLKNVNESCLWIEIILSIRKLLLQLKILRSHPNRPGNQSHKRMFNTQMNKIKDWLLTQWTKNKRKWREWKKKKGLKSKGL